jgi:hypothetical protein
VLVVATTEEEATGVSYNDDETKTKTDTMTTMTKTTMLPSLQMGRMMNAAAINQYKQQSTV